MLAMPSYSGRPHVETYHALVHDIAGMQAQGWTVEVRFSVGDSLIPRARNQIVAIFLAGDGTDLVMIDDDVVWEPDALLRLLTHPVDVVGGVYPKRTEPLEFPARRLVDAVPDANGLLAMEAIPAGFLRLSRTALEAMARHYDSHDPQTGAPRPFDHPLHRAYRDSHVPGGKAWSLFGLDLSVDFDNPPTDNLKCLTGEDFTFCRLWREMGGTVYADTLLRFQHIGRKAYDGCYAERIAQVTHDIGRINLQSGAVAHRP